MYNCQCLQLRQFAVISRLRHRQPHQAYTVPAVVPPPPAPCARRQSREVECARTLAPAERRSTSGDTSRAAAAASGVAGSCEEKARRQVPPRALVLPRTLRARSGRTIYDSVLLCSARRGSRSATALTMGAARRHAPHAAPRFGTLGLRMA